ncbi:MAG: dihydrodipicolinate synthase family protein [Clostridia bacterium]|nr:dihydrodipicolinate synthase family protein [Clostridia bacterium]
MKKHLFGPYAVLMTPFAGSEVDLAAYEAQLMRTSGTGISGYVTNGTTAEFVHLSLDEQMALSELVAKKKDADKELIVSACTANAADTVRLARHAGEIGARAVLVCPPYYLKHPKAEREAYYTEVADKSPVPVVLYNIPFFTEELELDVIYRLFKHENIIGIKDSSANMKRLMHMVNVTEGSETAILTGTDDILLPALVGGCVGSMTALAAIFPDRISELYRAIGEGNLARAREIQSSLMPTLREADAPTFPRGYKALLERESGIPFGDKEVSI